MTRRSRTGLAGNTVILTVGTVLQTIVALVTVPLYLDELGEARFGVWVIAGTIITYFGLFDRAMGAAAQREMAMLSDARLRSSIFWTALILNAAVGIVAGAAAVIVGELLFSGPIELPGDLRREAKTAVPLFAASVPLLAVTAVFQGALMARGRIASVSVLETGRLFVLQLLPLAFVYWLGADLGWLAVGVLVALSLSALAYFAASAILALSPQIWTRPARALVGRLFHFGKWISVTSLLTPLLDFSDRVLIGVIRGTSSVTAYAIPYNLATRLTTIPLNVVRVAFPRFASLKPSEGRALGLTAALGVAAVTAPAAVIGSVVSGPFFEWWLGGDIAEQAAPIAAVLFAGFWVNGLGYVPATLLQAQGRPEVPAKLHMLELVPFLVLLGAGVYVAGPIGAAIAWSLRALADTLVLMTLTTPGWWRNRPLLAAAAVVALAAVVGALLAFEPVPLAVLGIPLTVLAVALAWRVAPPEFRERVRRRDWSGADDLTTPETVGTDDEGVVR